MRHSRSPSQKVLKLAGSQRLGSEGDDGRDGHGRRGEDFLVEVMGRARASDLSLRNGNALVGRIMGEWMARHSQSVSQSVATFVASAAEESEAQNAID